MFSCSRLWYAIIACSLPRRVDAQLRPRFTAHASNISSRVTVSGSCAHSSLTWNEGELVRFVVSAVENAKLPFNVSETLPRQLDVEPAASWLRGSNEGSVLARLRHRFLWWVLDTYGKGMSVARCLELGDGRFAASIFTEICGTIDTLDHIEGHRGQDVNPGARTIPWSSPPRRAQRAFVTDALNLASYPKTSNAYDVVFAITAFEHYRNPHAVATVIGEVLAPGGLLIWHSPFEIGQADIVHTRVDYYRFTVASARNLAHGAGLDVHFAEGDGSFAAVLSTTLGLHASFLTDADITAPYHVSQQPVVHYLASRLVARKPGGTPNMPRARHGPLASRAQRERTRADCNRTPDTEGGHFTMPRFADAVKNGLRIDQLPLGGLPPGSFAGVNRKRVHGVRNGGDLKVAKRDWRDGAQSNSISRHTQHLFMWKVVHEYGPALPRARCLDWDGWYGGSIFGSVCAHVDVISYAEPYGRVQNRPLFSWSGTAPKGVLSTRWYNADAHTMSRQLENGVYDVVLANSCFEHFHTPALAMFEVAKLLRPGGILFWHTPFQFEQHGVPYDFFRFTPHAARALAEDAGLVVDFATTDGSYAAVLSNVLGLGSKYWTDDQLLTNAHQGPIQVPYLSTRMIARKR